MRHYPNLFRPLAINGCEIRNRIVLTGHGTGMPRDGTPNQHVIDYYAERAKGGVGLIMLGTQQVHPSSPGITGLLCNYSDAIIEPLRKLADTVHSHGGKVFGYIGHMGFATSARPTPLWSASPNYEMKYGEVAHPMSREEIAEVVAAFADAAERNIKAGLDGVQVHCGHGLLVQQFLSPLTNQRTDEYGGDVVGRTRFAREILTAVRERIGPDVPLGIRISGDELMPGGLTVDDMCEITPMLVEAGKLDFVDVSAGNDGDVISNMLHEPPMGLPFAPYASVSRRIKEACPGVTIIHATRIATADEAEQLLERQDADMAGMVRPLIADPFLPTKAAKGEADTVIPCVACEQACFGRLFRGLHISCVGNPVTGRERRWYETPAATPRRVVVVGGGPSGMEAARIAAKRGHQVTLIDRRDELGGRMNVARRPRGRAEWGRMIAQKSAALARLGVDVRLGQEADAEMILSLKPDAILLATGGEPRPISIPGAETAPVMIVDEAVLNPDAVGERVLVVDNLNRTPAMATAIDLALRGRKVELCTQSYFAGKNLVVQNLAYFSQQAALAGVVFTPCVKPVRFEGKKVTLQNVLTHQDLPAKEYDTIVIADPGLPETKLVEALSGCGVYVRAIGDAYAPRDIEAAFLDGFEAALSL